MFKLRKLELKDAPLMLEWMHDSDVVRDLKADFAYKTLDDCKDFIRSSAIEKDNVHRAIVKDDDTYLGTVSLKNIDPIRNDAEFAITIRKVAMGTGASTFAIKAIIDYGLKELDLHYIYWYVSKENERAIRFYDKNGYKRIAPEEILESEENPNYIWYLVKKDQKGKI